VEVLQALELGLLLILGGAGQLDRLQRMIAMRVAEGVDADQGQGAVVLLVLVVQAQSLKRSMEAYYSKFKRAIRRGGGPSRCWRTL
jgi:hypothetical protein